MIWRKLFFLFEKLNITPGERRLVLSALLIVMILSAALMILHPKPRYDTAYYAPQVKLFQEKVAEAKRRDSMLKAPFYNLAALQTKLREDTAKSEKKVDKKKLKVAKAIPLININTAGLDSLVLLPGVGPKTAQKIVDYRKANGPFQSLGSIKKVKGIGDKKLKEIVPHIHL